MDDIKRINFKFLTCLLAFYLAVLYAVIIPLHYHKGFDSHGDCHLCAVATSPVIFVDTSPIHISLISLLTLVYASAGVKIRFVRDIRLRGPPISL